MAQQTPQLHLLQALQRSAKFALLPVLLSIFSARATSSTAETLQILTTTPASPPLTLVIRPDDTTFFGIGRVVAIVCSHAEPLGASDLPALNWMLSCPTTCPPNTRQPPRSGTAQRTLSFLADLTWNGVNATCYDEGSSGAAISRAIRVSELPTIEPPEARLLEGTEVNLTCSLAATDLSRSLTWSWSCGGSNCHGTTGRGGSDGEIAYLIIDVSALWDNAVVSCASSKYFEAAVNRTIRVRRRIAPEITPARNVTFFEGRSSIITCAFTDGSVADNDLSWRFSCPPFYGPFRSDSCGSSQLTTENNARFNSQALRIYIWMVTASEWNGAIVSCYSAVTGLSTQVNISTRPVPTLIVRPRVVDVLDTMQVTVHCTAPDLWRSNQLQWSVRDCSAPPSSPNGCQLVEESAINATTIRAMFTATLDWDQATLVCLAETPVSQESLVAVSVRGVPPLLIIPYDYVDIYLGLNVTVTCGGGNVWSAERLWWTVRDCRSPAGRTGEAAATCSFAADERLDNVTRRVSFTATALWNGSTIACSASVPVFQEGSVRVIVRGWPPFSLSKTKVTAYSGMAVQVSCLAPLPWTAAQLSWSVRRCQTIRRQPLSTQRSSNQLVSPTSGCQFTSDEDDSDNYDGDNVAVRQASFIATEYWDGATIACSSFYPIVQQIAADVRVQVFPGLVLTPPESSLSLSDGANVTLLCAASEYFRPIDLVWTVTCTPSVQCPGSRQGIMATRGSGNDTIFSSSVASQGSAGGSTITATWRYLAFKASNAWNGAKVTCSVQGLESEDYHRSKTIVVLEPGMSDATIATIVIGSCIGALAVLTFAAWAAYFSRKPKRQSRKSGEGGKTKKKKSDAPDAVGQNNDRKQQSTRKPKPTDEKAAEGKPPGEHATEAAAAQNAATKEKPEAGKSEHGGDGKKVAEKKKGQHKNSDAVPSAAAASASPALPAPPQSHPHKSTHSPRRERRQTQTPTATEKTATDKTATNSTANAGADVWVTARDGAAAHSSVDQPPLSPTDTNRTADQSDATAAAVAAKPRKLKSRSAAAGMQSAAPQEVKKKSRSLYK